MQACVFHSSSISIIICRIVSIESALKNPFTFYGQHGLLSLHKYN